MVPCTLYVMLRVVISGDYGGGYSTIYSTLEEWKRNSEVSWCS